MLNIISHKFKSMNGYDITVRFKGTPDNLFRPAIHCGDGRSKAIPLLLERNQVESTIDKLNDIDKLKPIKFDYLLLIVEGACTMTMKRG